MSDIRIISPSKLVSARGSRTRRQIADASNNKFNEQDLYNWEKGLNLPRSERLPYLVNALGVIFEDISENISVDLSA